MPQKQSIGIGCRLGSARSVKHHSCKRGYRVSDQYKIGAPIMMIPKEFDVRKIDVIAFGVVSVLFLIFNVSYWITFLGVDVTLVQISSCQQDMYLTLCTYYTSTVIVISIILENTLPSQLYKCLYLIFINVLIPLMFILPRKRIISQPSLTPDKTTNYSQTRQNIRCVLAFTLLFKIYSIWAEIYHQFVYNLVRNLKDTLFIDFLGKYVLILSHLAKYIQKYNLLLQQILAIFNSDNIDYVVCAH